MKLRGIFTQHAPYLSRNINNISHSHSTRLNNTYNLQLPLPRHEFARQSSSYTGPHAWDTLDIEIKQAQSVKMFKSMYKCKLTYYLKTSM